MKDPKITVLLDDGYYAPSSVLWLLADELTIKHICLLFLNEDPEIYQGHNWREQRGGVPRGYLAIEEALLGSLRKGKLVGTIHPRYVEWGQDEGALIPNSIDPDTSTIDMDSLKEWLKGKNVEINHLFELAPSVPTSCRDREHPNYSPRLAATVAAWDHVSENFQEHICVKEQLRVWLEENAAHFGIDGDELKPTKNFLNAATLIANWNSTGGRTRLQKDDDEPMEQKSANPSKVLAPFKITPAEKPPEPQYVDFSKDMDDEIPF